MIKKEWTCRVLSPMFMYGYSNLELRPTEVKALMRYVYRIAYLEADTRKLYEAESNRFGDAEEQASPFRIQMRMNRKQIGNGALVQRKEKTFKSHSFLEDTSFRIILRAQSKQEIERAEEALILSLLLGGMGKRSRRGRGCVVLENERIPKNELLPTIVNQLNRWNGHLAQPPYEVDGNEIRNTQQDLSKFNRPIIERIRLGKEFKNINTFFNKVDKASHEIKKEFSRYGSFATGFAKGSGNRFASSIIVSMTQTSEGVLVPIYTYVLAKYKRETLDMKNEERNQFIRYIEEGKC